MTLDRSDAVPPVSLSSSSSSSSPSATNTKQQHQDDRQDRSIRPLGTSRRPGRSRTPTPSNPNPNPSPNTNPNSDKRSNQHSLRRRASQTQENDSESAPIFMQTALSPPLLSTTRSITSDNRKSTSNSALTSTSSQMQESEKRPWFPYPSPHHHTTTANSINLQRSSSSSSNRRISNISNESSSSTSAASNSSASSYNSEDINTRLFNNKNSSRRAISAEPEQASHSIARGKPLYMESLQERKGRKKEIKVAASSSTETIMVKSDSTSSSSSSEDEKERAHFKSVLRSFDAYLSHSLAANNARRRSFYSLPRSHRLLLSSLGSLLPTPLLPSEGNREEQSVVLGAAGRGFKARLDEIDDRIRRNADVLSQIVDDSRSFLGEEKEENGSNAENKRPQPDDEDGASSRDRASTLMHTDDDDDSPVIEVKSNDKGMNPDEKSVKKGRTSYPRIPDHDLDKVRSTIKQYVRDWSQEGSSEREAAYDPILEALEDSFKHISSAQRSQLRVLVPGAGLGRLAFEVAWLGFSCQGNEFSFYMLLASHFILNKTIQVNQHIIYPFIHSSSNWRTANDMLCAIQIPDINPTVLPSHIDFSMVAGEFIEVYSKEQEKAAWNAVATCFFIDTAHNLTRYLEVINHALVLGGVWINVGPLLWHYEGAVRGDLSIELTLDEVLGLIGSMGFHIEAQRTLPPQSYTGNQGSMLSYQYSPEFWIARKIREVIPAKVV